MPPTRFTVTQVRIAASCPRILYFDSDYTRRRKLKQPSITRIWKGDQQAESTACGPLFHDAIERFNSQAAADDVVQQLLKVAPDAEVLIQHLLSHIFRRYVPREALFQKTGAQQEAFMNALRRYVGELADILAYAVAQGKPGPEILDYMFGDTRRKVDVTFPVGPAGEQVEVVGMLDYVFHDWRNGRHRIIDYKLTPAQQPANDLFQVCVYALMHHTQHQTKPDVGVLYLHPKRRMIEKRWEEIDADRHKVLNLLASMREWINYDEATGAGLKPPGEPLYCESCRWNAECVRRLGPKDQGEPRAYWTAAAAPVTPAVRHTDLPAETPSPASAPTARPAPNHDRQRLSQTQPLAELGVPAEALWIGQTISGQLVGLPRQALPTHLVVAGAAGSGKTWLAKALAEETIRQGVPVLAIDPQGDLVQFVKRREADNFTGAERTAYDQFWAMVEPRILTPGTSHGLRVSLSPMRLASARELATIADPERRGEELKEILATAASHLVGLAKTGGETDAQQTFVFQVLQRLVHQREASTVELEDVATALLQPDAVGIDDADRFIREAERKKLARRLNSLLHGPSANLFTGGLPLNVNGLLQPDQPGKTPLNILYLNALRDDDQKQFFVAALAAEVYRWMVTTGSRVASPSLLFYLDEAKDYLPAGARKPPSKDPLLRLFAQGRKYGVACLICTQSPRSVDYQVLTNCSTKLIGRLESSQDVERVADWFATQGGAPLWLNGRKGAEKGTFVARWPGLPPELEGQTFRSRMLFTAHEGAWSPERVEQEGGTRSG
jgi:CRISPR/Cas system-associated exonuclease Cas4 (RecB family)